MYSNSASCGISFKCPAEIMTVMTVATEAGYDFICFPLVHPRFKILDPAVSQIDKEIDREYPNTRSDLVLPSKNWSSSVVALISRNLNFESADPEIRRDAEFRFEWEMNFAIHLSVAVAVIPVVKPQNPNLGRLLRGFLQKHMRPQIWLRLPMASSQGDPWLWWNLIRSIADFDRKLFVALELDNTLIDAETLKLWTGEPVKALIVPTRLFILNKKGFPVLPRVVQGIIKSFIDFKVQFIVEGIASDGIKAYQKYLDHLVKTHDMDDPIRLHVQGYEDFLQSPLQPLMDNLESGTYEVFEKDPVKYSEYKRAIKSALLDRVTDKEAESRTLVLMVLGAGRGPLVRAALEASAETGRQVKVFAVEKNPYAVVTLKQEKEETWKDKVEVISSDMRNWKPDELADIIISELLGSFGDNELSPECLYSSQHLLKPDGISIPSSYTSWVGPVQSAKLYQAVRDSADPEKNPDAHYETPYVVHLQNFYPISETQPLFTFVHPLKSKIDNTRFKSLTFEAKRDCVLTGFGGYFECVLYRDITLSTNPQTHSKSMISWFPIYFPHKFPVVLKKEDKVEVQFWRLVSNLNVWYEWAITKPVPLPIHNPNGRSYTIGL